MMKQPLDNPNATLTEKQVAEQRMKPLPNTQAPSEDEIASLAHQFWIERNGEGGSAEEDWQQAEEVLRNRTLSASKP